MKLMTRARAAQAAALITGVAIGCAAVGSATADSSVAAKPKVVTHHYALAASGFAPDSLDSPTSTNDYFNKWDPTTLSNQSNDRCFDAGLALPPSVTLKSITFYYTPGSDPMSMELNRQNLPAHAFKRLVDTTTGTLAPHTYTHKTFGIAKANATVNNGQYAYSVGVCPDGTSTFSGLIITYTEPS
jgi:hypothetical protein